MHVKHGLLLAAICYLAPTLPSQANDMLPFDTVRQQFRTTQDLTRVSHLYRRCAALHLNVAALLLKKKRGVAAKDYEHLANHFMMLSERLDIEIDKKLGLKTAKPMEAVSLSVRGLAELYDQRMKTNLAQRGDAIAGDSGLESELAECLKPDVLAKSVGR